MFGRHLILAAVAAAAFAASSAQAIVITFEEGRGHDGQAINTQYSGVTFVGSLSGTPWIFSDASTGLYNVSSYPSGQSWSSGNYWLNDYVGALTGYASGPGDNGQINFTSRNTTFVQVNYCSYSGFHMDAYNAAGALIGTAAGSANLRYINGNNSGPGTIAVTAPTGQYIDHVILHDSGNYWVMDNLVTNATDIVLPGQLQIVKFLDENRNHALDAGEDLLSGWNYHVTGPDGYDNFVSTGAGGAVTLSGLVNGSYTITEVLQPGWDLTTANPVTVTIAQGATQVVDFGNAPVPEPASLGLLGLGAVAFLRRRR